MTKKMNHKLNFILLLLIIIFAMGYLADFLYPSDPNKINMLLRNSPPSSEHLLGTDNMGRDVLTRLIHGGKKCLTISLFSSSISMLIAFVIGSIAAWYGGLIDKFAQLLMSIFQGIPGLSIAIAVVGIFGSSEISITIALIVASWAANARIIRAWVLNVKNKQFIEASKIFMPGSFYIISKCILPLILPAVIVLTLNRMGRTLLSISALSFIGVGLQAPSADWGVMIQDARDYINIQPLALFAPAIMICLTSFLLSYVAEIYRDHLDIFEAERFEL